MGFARFTSLVFAFFLVAASASANFCGDLFKVEVLTNSSTKYRLGIGALVRLQEQDGPNSLIANFMGRATDLSGNTDGFVFYSSADKKIHIFAPEQIRIADLGEEEGASALVQVAPVVRSQNQMGGTCAAYALFNCMRQLHANRVKGNGVLGAEIGSESNRLDFLAYLINKNYIQGDGTQMPEIASKLAQDFGLRIRHIKGVALKQSMVADLEAGNPVLFRFDCRSKTCTMGYEVHHQGTGKILENSLEQPRFGGIAGLWRGTHDGSVVAHAVIFTGILTAPNGERMLIVVDSNVRYPRLWPLRELDRYEEANLQAWTFFEP